MNYKNFWNERIKPKTKELNSKVQRIKKMKQINHNPMYDMQNQAINSLNKVSQSGNDFALIFFLFLDGGK